MKTAKPLDVLDMIKNKCKSFHSTAATESRKFIASSKICPCSRRFKHNDSVVDFENWLMLRLKKPMYLAQICFQVKFVVAQMLPMPIFK